jgi:photosystem II stability/assembly factor-like uncharacterized protein
MKNLASVLIFAFLLFFTNNIHGQALNQELLDTKNYHEIVQIIKEKFEGKGPDEAVEGFGKLKHWNRWMWVNRNRLDQAGNVVNVQPYIDRAFEQRKESTALQSFARGVNNEWTDLGPFSYINLDTYGVPGIGRVNKVAFHPTDPNTFFIGSPTGGLWKTTDFGNNWNCLTNEVSNQSIAGIVINPSNPNLMFILTGSWAGGNSSGVFRSADGGNTWANYSSGMPGGAYICYDLKQHPTDLNILFAATSSGLYKSEDGGINWVRRTWGRIYDIEFKPGSSTEMYISVNRSNTTSIRWSNNQGNTFQPSNLDVPLANGRVEMTVTPADPNYLYLIEGPNPSTSTLGGFYRSTDSGRNFVRRLNLASDLFGNQAWYDMCIVASRTNKDIVYIGSQFLHKTIDGGLTIEQIANIDLNGGSDKYVHPDIQDLAINPLNNYLFIGSDGGINYSTNAGDTYIDKSATYATSQFYRMSMFNLNHDIIAGGAQDNGLFYGTSNNNFYHYGCCDGFETSVNANDQYLYSNTNHWSSRMNMNTNVITGIVLPSPYQEDFFKELFAHPYRISDLYIGSRELLFSSNYGNTVSVLGFGANYDIQVSPTFGNRIYMAGDADDSNGAQSAVLRRSDDNGLNYVPIPLAPNSPTLGLRVSGISISPSNSNHVYVSLGGTVDSNKVFMSLNAGLTWTNITGDLPNLPVNCIDVTSDGKVFIGNDIGVYYRDLNHPGWIPLANNLPSVPVTTVIVSEATNKVKISTYGRGFFEADLPDGTCDFVNKLITETLRGYHLFIASNTITHQGFIPGESGNKIYMMAGDYIEFKTGAEAKFNAFVNAKIGECNSFPLRAVESNQNENQNPSNKFDYGYIDYLKINGGILNLEANIFQKGSYGLIMTDIEGNSIKVFLKDKHFEEGIHKLTFDLSNINQEMAYVHLITEEKHCHFQEINMPKQDR